MSLPWVVSEKHVLTMGSIGEACPYHGLYRRSISLPWVVSEKHVLTMCALPMDPVVSVVCVCAL